MKKALQLFLLSRPINVALGIATVYVGSSILDQLNNIFLIGKAMAVVALLITAANLLNDYVDSEIDKTNHPDRSIPSGVIDRKTALYFSVLFFICGSTLSFGLPRQAITIVNFVTIPLLVAYNLFLKETSLVGNIVIASLLGLVFLFTGTVFENMGPMWIPFWLAFGLSLIREIVKDIQDIDGDKRASLRTFPIIAGEKRAVRFVILLTLLFGVSFFLPYAVGIFGIRYLLVLIFGIEIPLFYMLFLLVKNPSKQSYATSSKILKICTLMGLVAIYVS